jgi:hypothetical protein
MYQGRRALDHLRFLDFTIIPGWSGYIFWRVGLVGYWRRHHSPRPPRPEPKKGGRANIPVTVTEATAPVTMMPSASPAVPAEPAAQETG